MIDTLLLRLREPRTLVIALAVSAAASLTMSFLHRAHGTADVLTLAVLLTAPIVWFAAAASTALVTAPLARGRVTPAAVRALVLVGAAVAGVVAASLLIQRRHPGGSHGHLAPWTAASFETALRDGAAVLPVVLLALVVVCSGRSLFNGLGVALADGKRRVPVGLAAGSLVAGLLAVLTPAPANAIATAAPACNAGSAVRLYDVAAVNVFVPYSRWANDAGGPLNDPQDAAVTHMTDGDPHGMVFVLQQDKAAVINWYKPLVGNADNNFAGDPAQGRRVRPRPLVLRANVGECVQIRLTNELVPAAMGPLLPRVDPRVSMHAFGVAYDPQTGDGSAVGYNSDTTVAVGQSTTYYWRAPSSEGMFIFRDMGMPAGADNDGGGAQHGLYGALAVEPTGARWFDATSGAELSSPAGTQQYTGAAGQSGDLYLQPVIALPNGERFRESIQLSQDLIPIIPNPATPAVDVERFSFNFGSEPEYKRDDFKTDKANRWCPDCVGEETSLSSWVFGDPSTVKLAAGPGPWLPEKPATTQAELAAHPEGVPAANVEDCGLTITNQPGSAPLSCWTANTTHGYQGDPIKIRFGHAGVYETHVFHLHAHTWSAEPDDEGPSGTNPPQPTASKQPRATTIDSQTYGPWTAYTADLNYGVGARVGTIGDAIFHCHLYPHFASGFWALLRSHDTYERGDGATPDGQRVNRLVALRDIDGGGLAAPASAVPPLKADPTAAVPGYPRFIPGEYGWRAPQPVNGVWQREFDPTTKAPLYRADGTPRDALATRIVAGQGLDPDVLSAHQDVAVPSGVATFRLAFAGQQTAPIAAGASAADVETALKALSAIQAVTVTGSGTSTDSYVITLVQWMLTGDLGITATDVVPEDGVTPTPTVSVTPSAGFPSTAAAATVAHRLSVEALSTRSYHDPSYLPGGAVNPDKTPLPGAPVVDPCPAGARVVTYRASIIQLPIVYNDAGWVDTQGRVMVADEDVDAVLAGTKKPEPFFYRVNAGDCITMELTNRTPNQIGNDAYQQLVQTNMVGSHIHLVNFDVLASDGSSNGWNYQQAAFTEDQATFDSRVIAGQQACDADAGCTVPLPDATTYDVVAQGKNAKANWLKNGQTIKERWFADYELRTVFNHDHHFAAIMQNRGFFNALIVEPKGYDFRDPVTGNYLQPVNTSGRGAERCTTTCVGKAYGSAIDVVGPQADDDFREFGVAVHDFVPLIIPPNGINNLTQADVQNRANAIKAPLTPIPAPMGDQGGTAINFKNAPMKLRQFPAGATPAVGNQVDAAYTFSSRIWGDPLTPLLRAYRGDNVRIRLIQGSHEEQHNFTVHGTRWQRDALDPAAQFINTRPIGVSEAFNIDAKGISCGTGSTCSTAPPGEPLVTDYMYGTTGVEDLYAGAWGVMRVFDQTTGSGFIPGTILRALPDNDAARPVGVALPASGVQNLTIPKNGTTADGALKKAPANDTCPAGVPVKRFDVSAINLDIKYNRYGDGDPYGLAYVLTADVAAIKNGTKKLEPLVLRANEGDCIQVNLTNSVDWTAFAVHGNRGTLDGDASMPLEPVPAGVAADLPPVAGLPWIAGKRVSLHPALVKYDVRNSDGATIGYNLDQTAGPGQTVTYRWFADAVTYADPANGPELTDGELGAIPLMEYGDVRGHRHHGLLAGLVVGPKDATFHDPYTGLQVNTGAVVDVHVPGRAEDYRDAVLINQNGLNLRNRGQIIPDAIPGDWPDMGERAISYTNAPLHRRLGLAAPLVNPAANPLGLPFTGPTFGRNLANVFSTTYQVNGRAIGDPDTPIIRAYAGDAIRFHVMQSSDRARMVEYEVSGHNWLAHPWDAGSVREGVGGSIATASASSFNMRAAGGDMQRVGDYRYGIVHGVEGLSAGSWGILRVYPRPAAGQERNITPLNASQNPYQGGRPIHSLDLGVNTPVVALSSPLSFAVIGQVTTQPVTATVKKADGTPFANETVFVTYGNTSTTVVTGAEGTAVINVPVRTPSGILTISASVADAATATFALEILNSETNAPRVTGITPAGTGIDPTTTVRTTFSERVHPYSLTASTFRLHTGSITGPVVPATATLAADMLSATLQPTSALPTDTQFVVELTTGITDLVGNRLALTTSSFTTRDTIPPPVPAGFTATAGLAKVDLKWTAVVAPDLAGYIVTQTVGGVTTRLTATPITGTTLTVSKLTRGLTYTFTVSSVDRSGNVSAPATATAVPR